MATITRFHCERLWKKIPIKKSKTQEFRTSVLTTVCSLRLKYSHNQRNYKIIKYIFYLCKFYNWEHMLPLQYCWQTETQPCFIVFSPLGLLDFHIWARVSKWLVQLYLKCLYTFTRKEMGDVYKIIPASHFFFKIIYSTNRLTKGSNSGPPSPPDLNLRIEDVSFFLLAGGGGDDTVDSDKIIIRYYK